MTKSSKENYVIRLNKTRVKKKKATAEKSGTDSGVIADTEVSSPLSILSVSDN
jgi:hypothetical protein